MALAVVAAGLVSVVVASPASAATATTCSTADEGSGHYASTLCWFDFTGYDPAQANSATGQDVSVALLGGSTLSEITCPEGAASLAPGASVACTATYTVVARDLTGDPLTNMATSIGVVPPGTPIDSGTSKVDISAPDKSGDLPGTGTQVGLIAILGALALLILGLAVLLLARRNRH